MDAEAELLGWPNPPRDLAVPSQTVTQWLDVLPVAVYICDADGTIVRSNKTAVELWGRAPDPGETEDRFCGAHRLFWPDGRELPKHEPPMAEALRSGQSCRQQEVHIERPDGSRVVVRVNIDPIRDSSGRIVGAVNCFQDVTEQETARQAMAQRDRFLSTIIETTPECVKLVARDGTLLEMNSAGLSMVEAGRPEDVMGGDTLGLIAPEFRDEWRHYHERVCDGERLTWEFDVIGLGGRRRQMETHAAPSCSPTASSPSSPSPATSPSASATSWRSAKAKPTSRTFSRRSPPPSIPPTRMVSSPSTIRPPSKRRAACRRSAATNGASPGGSTGRTARPSRTRIAPWRSPSGRTERFTALKSWRSARTDRECPCWFTPRPCATAKETSRARSIC